MRGPRYRAPMRIVAIVIGALLLVVALPSALTGLGLVGGVGDGSRFDIPIAEVQAPAEVVAVSSPEIDLTGITVPSWLADTTITLDVDGPVAGEPLFGGIASAGDVAAYLDGAAVATVDVVEDASGSIQVDGDGLALRYDVTAGSESLPVPGDQDFWIDSSEDGRLRIALGDLSGRRTVLVLMRADGRPGIAGDIEGSLRSPLLWTVGIVLFIGGLIGSAIGIVLILVGVLRKGETRPPAASNAAGPTGLREPDTAGGSPAVDTGPPPTGTPAVDTRPLT
jgi:hypothetical protein